MSGTDGLLIIAVGDIGPAQAALTQLAAKGAAILLAASREVAANWVMGLQEGDDQKGEVCLGELEISVPELQVTWSGSRLPLTAAEVRMLALLAQWPGHVVSFEALTEAAWGGAYFGDSSAVRSAVKRLRKKLVFTNASIESAWGIGYKLHMCDSQ